MSYQHRGQRRRPRKGRPSTTERRAQLQVPVQRVLSWKRWSERSLCLLPLLQMGQSRDGSSNPSERHFLDDLLVALAAVVVLEAFLGVALGGDVEVGFFAAEMLGVEVFEEGDAPLAAGAGGEALGDEGGDRGILDLEEGADFPE